MQLKILAFGIAKDIVGGNEFVVEVENLTKVGALKKQLLAQYPKFESLTSLSIAVNNEYADEGLSIYPTDEVVLIPPVSGG